MSYQSFFIGFILLAFILAVVYSVAGHILEKRGSTFYPMIELYISLLIGIIYSVVAICISSSWLYIFRVLAGLAVGVCVGWALVMTQGIFRMLFGFAASFSNKIRSHHS